MEGVYQRDCRQQLIGLLKTALCHQQRDVGGLFSQFSLFPQPRLGSFERHAL